MDRREALQLLGALAASSFAASLPVAELEAMGVDAHRALADGAADGIAPGSLTAAERATLAAAADTIIPRTSTPGARDVGVPAFAEHMLDRWYPEAEREAVRAGLRALDADARARHGRAFASLGVAARTALLVPLDEAQVAARTVPARGAPSSTHWFGTVKYLTAWGWCTSQAVQRDVFRTWPMPGRYDPDAHVVTSTSAHGHE
jgi:gluconate 2-dehydrogenase gamma chain